MYHSITLKEATRAGVALSNRAYNTFDDWHLLAPSAPVVVPPQPKTNYVDVLGAHGSLDFSEALTGTPTYSDRQGSWEFLVLNPGDVPEFPMTPENGRYDWATAYAKVMEAIQGVYFKKIILDDDPVHYYQGRLWVNDWRSGADWNQIVINYRLKPFKIHIRSGVETL